MRWKIGSFKSKLENPDFLDYIDFRVSWRLVMVKVTAAEFQKQFGRFRDLALKSPVSVTHHGRESLVLLSNDEYQRLKALDTRQPVYPWELADDLIAALDRAEPAATSRAFDHELIQSR
jgi:PHD/YefM family antitoxin component YafN of YafNO toxin-antitoxin module